MGSPRLHSRMIPVVLTYPSERQVFLFSWSDVALLINITSNNRKDGYKFRLAPDQPHIIVFDKS